LLNDITLLSNHLHQINKKYNYIWVSNAYNMQWNRFLLSKSYTSNKLNELKNTLTATNTNYLLEVSGMTYEIN
jgi:hypothetical protein